MFRIVEFANVFWKLFFRAAAHESLIPGWLEFSSVLVMQEENGFPVNDDGVVAVITGRFIVQRKKIISAPERADAENGKRALIPKYGTRKMFA